MTPLICVDIDKDQGWKRRKDLDDVKSGIV